MTGRVAAIVAVAALAACARGPAPAPAPSGSERVGYIRMEELVKIHPLYAQLSQYDRSIAAFDLSGAAPRAAAPDRTVVAREHDLEHQLKAAADRTSKLLGDKQKQYQAEESRAIAAALAGAGRGGASAAQIGGAVNATARQQSGAASAQAGRDLEAYRTTLSQQGQAQIAAAQRTLAQRADRTYRSKADELQSKEAALSLRLANEDAPQRLALHTKLSSLALDDAAREDAQKQLTALDRKEGDAVGAQRNRDQQTLAALNAQLQAQVRSALQQQVDRVHSRTMALLNARQTALSQQLRSGPVVQTTVVNGQPTSQVNPNLPPAVRERIQQLHNDYQKRFESDAKTTIADFNKTRAELSRRYAELHALDAGAQGSADGQVTALRKKRETLYAQITGQISREVRVIAQQRGISVVLTDVVAPAAGVDLTPDAKKDIESLHE